MYEDGPTSNNKAKDTQSNFNEWIKFMNHSKDSNKGHGGHGQHQSHENGKNDK